MDDKKYRLRASIYVDFVTDHKDNEEAKAIFRNVKRLINKIDERLTAYTFTEFEEILIKDKPVFNSTFSTSKDYVHEYKVSMEKHRKKYKEE